MHRLTTEQRERADTWYPLACRIAMQFARSRPRYRDELLSAAGLALCEAARSWKPEIRPFPVWCRLVISVRCLDELRRLARQSDHESLPDHLPGRGPAPDAAFADEDELAATLRKLPKRHGRVLGPMAREGLNQAEAAARAGLTQSRASATVREARSMLAEVC